MKLSEEKTENPRKISITITPEENIINSKLKCLGALLQETGEIMKVAEAETENTKKISIIITPEEKARSKPSAADFESAISATKFGKFNLLLILTAIPTIFTIHFETSALAYVFPAAQCDLNLSLDNRGLINAIIFAGMISSCFFWGSLIDIYGRKSILIVSLFLDAVFVLMATFSSSLPILLVAKFLGGFIVNGSATALTPYLSEFHGKMYRSRVPLTVGFFYNVANVVLPLLAWSILPLDINFSFYEGGFEFHAWNVFLFACSLPAFISGIFFTLMPEAPKYLMTKGKNEKALKIFQKIYRFNTGKARENYPIKQLVEEKQIVRKMMSVKEAWRQIAPLFSQKYLVRLSLVSSLQFTLMLSINSFYLWLPQIFQTMNDYQYFNNSTASFCTMMDSIQTSVSNTTDECAVNLDNSSVYINSIVVALVTITGYITATCTINKLGKKSILGAFGGISAATAFALYFAQNSLVASALICIHIMGECVCFDVIVSVIIDLFPTSLRASALSVAFMCGRIGSFVGNLLFPILLQAGCEAPIFTVGGIILGSTITAMFLPNTDLKSLE